jgi:hypothetical protein
LAAGSRDDPHAAYRLLSKSTREGLTEPEFVSHWRATTEERKSQLAALAPSRPHPPTEHARGLWSDGRQAELTRQPDGWKLASPRISANGAASPEDAVRHFAEALQHHDLDGLLGLLADPLRGMLERELSERLSRIKSALQKEIEVDGSRARIRLDEHYYLELKQENGRWKVSDFN